MWVRTCCVLRNLMIEQKDQHNEDWDITGDESSHDNVQTSRLYDSLNSLPLHNISGDGPLPEARDGKEKLTIVKRMALD
jgi:hypothetical protein